MPEFGVIITGCSPAHRKDRARLTSAHATLSRRLVLPADTAPKNLRHGWPAMMQGATRSGHTNGGK
jgi:hypothetical protein